MDTSPLEGDICIIVVISMEEQTETTIVYMYMLIFVMYSEQESFQNDLFCGKGWREK